MTGHHDGLSDEQAALLLLTAIVGRERSGWLELRHRHQNSNDLSVQKWFDLSNPDEMARAVDYALRVGPTLEMFAGNAPRVRKSGKADAVGAAWVLSVDCDSAESIAALRAFPIKPTLLIHSGGRTPSTRDDGDGLAKVQAHWVLREPITNPLLFRLGKERLAAALGGDAAFTDAGRVVRIPGTRWLKNHKDRPVLLAQHLPSQVYSVDDVLQGLPAAPSTAQGIVDRGVRLDDVLKEIPAPEYWADLYGLAPDHRGYIRCPFHANGRERTPSLCLFGPATRYHDRHPGWFCFGCRRGADIYEAAALRFGYPTTPGGPAFLAIRARLTDYYTKKGAAR